MVMLLASFALAQDLDQLEAGPYEVATWDWDWVSGFDGDKDRPPPSSEVRSAATLMAARIMSLRVTMAPCCPKIS